MNIDEQIVEILEDFAENLASAKEEDNFAQLNKVVTDSVDEAKSALKKLINEARIKELENLITAAYQMHENNGYSKRIERKIENRINSLKEGKE